MGNWWNKNVKPSWTFGVENVTIARGRNNPTDAVKRWQRILGITDDGKFGPNTEAKTKEWQSKKGLTADGVVGPKSWAAATPPIEIAEPILVGPDIMAAKHEVQKADLTTEIKKAAAAAVAASGTRTGTTTLDKRKVSHPTLRIGDKGAAVSEWQKVLGITPADGNFGPQTDKSTKSFQSKAGLTADGVVGPQTWAAAYSSAGTPKKVTDSTKTLPDAKSDPTKVAKVTKAPDENKTVVVRKRRGIPGWAMALGAALGIGAIGTVAVISKKD